jgi:tetratricopeptide (TPR) repeat protein
MAIVEYRVSEKNVDNEPSSYEIDIRTNLAKLLWDTNDFKEALEEFILLLKVDPKNADAYHMAGKCYIKLGAYDKAIQYFRHAIKYNPQLQDAYFDLGLALYESQALAEALNEFIYSIKFNPKNYRAYYYMGAIYRQLQDYAKAIECLNIAERDKEVQVQSILNKGTCYLALGNIPKTIEELVRGIKLHTAIDNTLFMMRYYLAEAYEQKKDVTSAIEQWEKISAHNSKFKDVGAKLEQYSDIRASDILKDYISSPISEFQNICNQVIKAMELTVVDSTIINNDEVHITAREASKMVGKTLLKLVIFTRINEPVPEEKVRASLDLFKSMNAQMCIIFSNSGYTRGAREFANTRPFEVYDSKKINELLSK